VDFTALASTTPGLQSVATGVVPAELPHRAMTFRTDFNAAVPAGGLTMGLVSNNVGFFVRALESITDVTVMANPKLLVINKQRGEVMVGNRDGYLTTTFTETTASQEVQFLETGTRLVVRPYIRADGYIQLEIHPEDSSGQVAIIGQSALPSETTTEVTSNVLVRDGHTILIGGLFREETTLGRSQTPGIGNLPYVGAMWRSTTDNTNREEVIILITVRRIRQTADEGIGEQLKDDAERYRIGQRNGLRWWGRARLAQSCVRRARKAIAKGDRRKALWYVDQALSMHPRMEEAINLKERLTHLAYWADEVRDSSVKYVIQRMIMTDLGRAPEPVIIRKKPRNGVVLDEDVKRAFGITEKLEEPLNLGGGSTTTTAPSDDSDATDAGSIRTDQDEEALRWCWPAGQSP